MRSHYHAIVWIDHCEARIFEFNTTDVDKIVVHAHGSNHRLHHRANSPGGGRRGADAEFLARVTGALDGVGALLITGPAAAKVELQHHLSEHAPAVARRVAAVETLDHPSDGALVALARTYFKASDRMNGQRP